MSRGFKALKQMIKALIKIGKYDAFTKRYKQLLEYMNIVSRNDSEKAINKILGLVSNLSDRKLLDNIYTVTLEALKTNKNEVRVELSHQQMLKHSILAVMYA